MEIDLQAHPWYHRQHHNGRQGFTNIWGPPREVPPLKAAAWLLGHAFRSKHNEPAPVRTLDPHGLRTPPERLRITWIGHSTVFLQTPTLNLLTDPIFSKRASPLSFAGPDRKPPLPIRLPDLPPVDVVLISHDHYDHLDAPSIRQLQQQVAPLFLVPLGVGRLVRSWGATHVLEMDWWQYADLAGTRFHCTPAKHFSGRGLTGRNRTLWASWYLQAGDAGTLYYAGDSGYAGHFQTIRDRLGPPEVVFLPIGAYRPRWFMQDVHVDPEEAVQVVLDLQAAHAIAIHWGTFDMAEEPIHEPAHRLRRSAARRDLAGRIHLLDIGEPFSPDRITTS